MISASKMDAANVEAVLNRDVELVAANEALSRLVNWDGLGVGESKARELYERTAAQVEEHASAERELRADLEARGACLQAEIAKLSQAQTALDYAGVRRAELEREVQSAHSDVDNMKAQLYTLRGLQKAWNEREKTLREMLGPRATDFGEAVLATKGVIDALSACRLLLQSMVVDKRIGVDGGCYPAWAGDMIRQVIDPAIEPRCPSGPDPPDAEPGG